MTFSNNRVKKKVKIRERENEQCKSGEFGSSSSSYSIMLFSSFTEKSNAC